MLPDNGKLTLSAWVYISAYATSAYAKYIDKGSLSWTLRRDNGSSRVEMRQDYSNPVYLSAINTSGIALNGWHYLVGTYDHEVNNMITYIDGSSTASSKNVPANQVLQNNSTQVRISVKAFFFFLAFEWVKENASPFDAILFKCIHYKVIIEITKSKMKVNHLTLFILYTLIEELWL